jgi:predicted ester cyclase
MDLELNKANVRRVFEEGFNQGNLGVVDEALTADATDRHSFEPGEPDFRTHLKGAIAMLRSAMPDLHAEVEQIIAEGDLVSARVRMTGTHTGTPLFGIPSSGRPVDVEQFHFMRSDELGRGVQHWANIGDSDMRRQVTAAARV